MRRARRCKRRHRRSRWRKLRTGSHGRGARGRSSAEDSMATGGRAGIIKGAFERQSAVDMRMRKERPRVPCSFQSDPVKAPPRSPPPSPPDSDDEEESHAMSGGSLFFGREHASGTKNALPSSPPAQPAVVSSSSADEAPQPAQHASRGQPGSTLRSQTT